MAKKSSTAKFSLKELESTLELYFGKKAPALPKDIKKIIVQYGPWLVLIFLVLSLPSILGFLGLGAIALPFAYLGGFRHGYRYTFTFFFSLAIILLQAFALPGLFKKTKKSWRLLFYSTLVAFVDNLLSFNLSSLIVTSVVGWYILFQIKDAYTK